MRIAATLAGAALGALMLFPVAVQAIAKPLEPPPEPAGAFEQAQKSDIAAGLDFAGEADDAERLQLKKRKKPQFQTRFFGE